MSGLLPGRADDNIVEVENGFMCLVCQKVSARKGHAKEHYMLVHGEENYEFICPMCPNGKRFKGRKTLAKHLRLKHNVSYKTKDLDPYMRLKPPSDGFLPYISSE